MKLIRNILFPALVVVLVGCSGTSATRDESGVGAKPIGGASSAGSGDDGYRGGTAFEPDETGDVLDNRTIYFAYDKSDVNARSMELLAGHARYLATNPGVEVRLEGHADERGSREYNIGLGERRAQAVREILLLRGVAARRMTVVSYGEERPAARGSNDESWSLNRRVELVYSE
jgi:peptidoglycan-associated lipoprotein